MNRRWTLLLVGVASVVVGGLCHGQPWAEPEMFKGLGLNLPQVIVNLGLFLVWIPVINSYFYVPLRKAMDDRNKELEQTFSEAEDLRNQMDAMRADYDQRLKTAEATAREQIQATIKEAQNLRQQLMAEASQRADELVRKAEQEIEADKLKVMTELRTHVVNLSLGAAEKVIGENMDSAKNRQLVEEFIDKVEATA